MHLPELVQLHNELPPDDFGTTRELLSSLGHGREPKAVMLTCWELGCVPDEVSRGSPGEIMIVQNPGGLVEAEESLAMGLAFHSIAYCLNQPDVRHLIVCGHTECKTLAALFSNDTRNIMADSRRVLLDVPHRIEELYVHRTGSEQLHIVVQETVLQQLANLRSHALVQSRLSDGSLRLHAWIRDDETSTVFAFNPETGQFCG